MQLWPVFNVFETKAALCEVAPTFEAQIVTGPPAQASGSRSARRRRTAAVQQLTWLHGRCAGLVGVWLAIKVLTLGRVLFGALRLFRQDSPLKLRHRNEEEAD